MVNILPNAIGIPDTVVQFSNSSYKTGPKCKNKSIRMVFHSNSESRNVQYSNDRNYDLCYSTVECKVLLN